jgi:hypothetical protein
MECKIIPDVEPGFVLECGECHTTFLFPERCFTDVTIVQERGRGSRGEPSFYCVPCPACEKKVAVRFRNFSLTFFYTTSDASEPKMEYI